MEWNPGGSNPKKVNSFTASKKKSKARNLALLDVSRAADYLSMSKGYVREMVQAGKLTSVKLPSLRSESGRVNKLLFTISELDKFIEETMKNV